MFVIFYIFKKWRIDIIFFYILIKVLINISKLVNWNMNGLYGRSLKIVLLSFLLNIFCNELYVIRIRLIGIIDFNIFKNNFFSKNG